MKRILGAISVVAVLAVGCGGPDCSTTYNDMVNCIAKLTGATPAQVEANLPSSWNCSANPSSNCLSCVDNLATNQCNAQTLDGLENGTVGCTCP